MSHARPPRPRRQFPGIAGVFSGGRWRWRACITVARRQLVGPLHDDQRQAYLDVDALRAKAERPRHLDTLGACLAALIVRARERGLEEHMVESVWRKPARALLRYFAEGVHLEALTTDVVRRYALWCLDGDPTLDEDGNVLQRPLSPHTVRKEYLRVLHGCFELAQLKSPVPAVLIDISQRLRRAPAVIVGLEIEDVAALLERIRTWSGRRVNPNQALDALFFGLVATTGLRAAELARVRRRDVHLEQGVIQVRAKSAAHPRLEPIAPELLEALRERCAELPTADTPLVPARGVHNPKDAPWAAQARYLNRMVMRWQARLGDKRLNLRALRRAHGTGLDALGSRYAVIRDGLGHSRTSDETPRYLTAGHREVKAAKTRLSGRLLGTQGGAPSANGAGSSSDGHAHREPERPGAAPT